MRGFPAPGANMLPRAVRNTSWQTASILLMGPPGSGKTSVGRVLAERLRKPLIDVDNDWLEPQWRTSVGAKLKELGDEAFLDLEDATLAKLPLPTPHIVSLTGSNPLRANGLRALSRNAVIVYLDCNVDTIATRLENMKVDRIVGMASLGLREVLARRYQVYENSYDVRVQVLDTDTPQTVADKVETALKRRGTYFVSTRAPASTAMETQFSNVLMSGLARDGGLYLNNSWDAFHSRAELAALAPLTYQQLCKRVLEKFSPFASPWELEQLISDGYRSFSHPDVLPLKAHGDDFYTLDQWHGPTASFKDLSLQLLPKFFRLERDPEDHKARGLLVATSGDTGSAALDGFGRDPMFPVIVMYPDNGVSPVQKLQMVTAPRNVCVIGVRSDFDWCQTLVKRLLNDPNPLVSWTSANSINLGRFLPQVVFAFSAHAQLLRSGALRHADDPFDLAIPTGNFGNIFAAIVAQSMGVPIRRLICASNDNKVLADFLATGVYDLRNRKFVTTISPSIDILVSSNLERWLYLLYNRDGAAVAKLYESLKSTGAFTVSAEVLAKMRSTVVGGWCNQSQCSQTIADTLNKHGVLLDPHTAVAKHVADTFKERGVPMVVASTAHFAKFPDVTESALLRASGKTSEPADTSLAARWSRLENWAGKNSNPIPDSLKALLHKPVNHQLVLPADESAIADAVKRYLSDRQ